MKRTVHIMNVDVLYLLLLGGLKKMYGLQWLLPDPGWWGFKVFEWCSLELWSLESADFSRLKWCVPSDADLWYKKTHTNFMIAYDTEKWIKKHSQLSGPLLSYIYTDAALMLWKLTQTHTYYSLAMLYTHTHTHRETWDSEVLVCPHCSSQKRVMKQEFSLWNTQAEKWRLSLLMQLTEYMMLTNHIICIIL